MNSTYIPAVDYHNKWTKHTAYSSKVKKRFTYIVYRLYLETLLLNYTNIDYITRSLPFLNRPYTSHYIPYALLPSLLIYIVL